MGDFADLVAKVGKRSALPGDVIDTGRGEPKGHIGILGIGEDERITLAGSRLVVGELLIERLRHRSVTIVPDGSRSHPAPGRGGIPVGSRAQPPLTRRATCSQRGTPLTGSIASTLHAPT